MVLLIDGSVIAAAPVSFLAGLLVGFWFGARFDLRKKPDET